MKCDFCKKTYEGTHMCNCDECDKVHPVCNECYDYYVKIGKITPKDSFGDLEKLK